jgi:hypothetical protein
MVPPKDAYVHVTHIERDPLVRTGAANALPSSFSAEVDDPQQPYALDLRVRTIPGRRPEVVELRMELRNPKRPGGITTEGLRSVQIAKALQMAISRAVKPMTAEAGEPALARPLRGVPVTEHFLEQVADVYRSAVASGSPAPVAEVSRQLGGSRPTAGRWVVQARKAGILRPALGTKPGEASTKRGAQAKPRR